MDRKQLLAEFIRRVWSEGEVAAVDDYLAERYTIHHDPGDPWEGQTLTRQGFSERVTASRALAPDQVFTLVRMVEEADAIAVAWTWRGTHLGDLPGIPATGRPLAMSGLTIYRFEAGRLAGHWQVADRLSVWRQLTGGG